ncbi:hypothetical protein [Phaeospirillum tilakii]|uniref:Beta-barrel assembly machine subunit BamE n=1 Tax=Phaeospirillum tilakii TaxID=741673 RepID=A0ABW5C8T7_9PROT
MMLRRKLLIASSLALIVGLAACTGPGAVYDRPNSHFDYPNSNVTDLTNGVPITRKKEVTSLSSKVGDVDLEQRLVADILAEKGGDILINPKYEWKSRMYPVGITIYVTTLTVTSYVGKMTPGHQVRMENRNNDCR